MKLLQNTEFQLDEILFQKRNKQYGAYVLRNESDRILTRSLFYGVAFFGLVSAVPLLMKSIKPTVEIIPESGPFIIKDVDPVDPPETVKPPAAQPPQIAVVDTRTPTPTRDATEDNPPAKVSDYNDAVPGFSDVKGDPPVVHFTPPVQNPPVAAPSQNPPVVVTVVDNTPKIKVDEEAVFDGGVQAFRSKVVSSFDTSQFEGSGEKINTVVTFIVEKDGTISDVKATGSDAAFNKEAERTIKKIKGKWTPAKLDGQKVRSYFRFPVSMMFE